MDQWLGLVESLCGNNRVERANEGLTQFHPPPIPSCSGGTIASRSSRYATQPARDGESERESERDEEELQLSGEFLHQVYRKSQRRACLREFPVPGCYCGWVLLQLQHWQAQETACFDFDSCLAICPVGQQAGCLDGCFCASSRESPRQRESRGQVPPAGGPQSSEKEKKKQKKQKKTKKKKKKKQSRGESSSREMESAVCGLCNAPPESFGRFPVTRSAPGTDRS